MVNEAVLRHWQEDPMDFILNDATGVEKGTIMKLSGTSSRRVVATAATDLSQISCAGIARREKITDTGRTRLSVFRKGVFDMVTVATPGAEGPIQSGDPVSISGVNTIKKVKN